MHHRLHRFLSFLLLCLASTTEALCQQPQHGPGDSLLRATRAERLDTNKVNALTLLQRHYYGAGLFDSALFYGKATLVAAEAIGESKSIGRTNYNLGLIYTSLTKYDTAAQYLEKATTTATALRDTPLLAFSLNALALSAQYQSDHSKAVDYLLQQLSLIAAGNNQKARTILPQTYSAIGFNLVMLDETERGIGYIRQGLSMRGYPDEARFRVMSHLSLVDIYIKQEKYNLARLNLDTAIELSASQNNVQLNTLVANAEGLYFQKTADTDRALQAYTRAYKFTDESKSDYLRAEVADNLATLYFEKTDFILATRYANEANEIGLRLRHHRVVANSYDVLSRLAKADDRYPEALRLSALSTQYRDSVRNIENQKTALVLESKYQHQRREKEIAALTLSNTENELALVKRSRILLLVILCAIALLAVLVMLIRNNRQRRQLAEKEGRLKEEQIRFLKEQQQVVSLQSMINGQETERLRIAKDLHDGLGGLFSTVKMHFSSLEHEHELLKNDDLFRKSYSLVNTASVELRRIAHNMMPEVLLKMGLVDAIKDLCSHVNAGRLLKISLQAYGMEHRLGSAMEIMLYRIIQELVNNIIRHSGASAAIIQFNRQENRLTVTVEDNGNGFNATADSEASHAGLATIQSRVSYLDGKLAIESAAGMGTTVMMDFLLNEGAV